MKEMAFTDAKARLSQVMDEAHNGEPTIITRHGRKHSVVVSFEDWMRATDKPSLWETMMDSPLEDGDIVRVSDKLRPVEF